MNLSISRIRLNTKIKYKTILIVIDEIIIIEIIIIKHQLR